VPPRSLEGFSKPVRAPGLAHEKPRRGLSNEWYTPRWLFDRLSLEFDLDPCAPALPHADWIPAARRICLPDDGLRASWRGPAGQALRVWVNPPYGRSTGTWMRRLAQHGYGVALVYARSDTRWWQETVPAATLFCLLAGRVRFIDQNGNPGSSTSGAPSALVAFGEDCARAVADANLGMVVRDAERQVSDRMPLWEERS
jgi:DNA N-6-adenine-methyltransferase (Dam)